jgi:hypothetical protein
MFVSSSSGSPHRLAHSLSTYTRHVAHAHKPLQSPSMPGTVSIGVSVMQGARDNLVSATGTSPRKR